MATEILFWAAMSCVNTGIYLVLIKWQVIEIYQLHRRPWMPECTFCFFFWISLFEIGKININDIISIQSLLICLFSALGMAALSRKLL